MSRMKKYWPAVILLGMLPGFIIWIVLYQVGFAGEYAGLLAGLGAIGALRFSGAELTKGKFLFGTVMLLLLSALANHVGYIVDVYNSINGMWSGTESVGFSYSEAAKIVNVNILRENEENMRTFYLEALIQGMLCSLLFWIGLFIYYVKVDKIEKEESGLSGTEGIGDGREKDKG